MHGVVGVESVDDTCHHSHTCCRPPVHQISWTAKERGIVGIKTLSVLLFFCGLVFFTSTKRGQYIASCLERDCDLFIAGCYVLFGVFAGYVMVVEYWAYYHYGPVLCLGWVFLLSVPPTFLFCCVGMWRRGYRPVGFVRLSRWFEAKKVSEQKDDE